MVVEVKVVEWGFTLSSFKVVLFALKAEAIDRSWKKVFNKGSFVAHTALLIFKKQ